MALEFKRGSLHDNFGGFDGFSAVLESFALLRLLIVLQNTAQRGNRDGFDV